MSFRPPQFSGETTTLPFLAGTIKEVGKAAGKFIDTLFRPLDMLTGTFAPAYKDTLSEPFDAEAEGVKVFGGKDSMKVPPEYLRSYHYSDLLKLTPEQLKENPHLRVVFEAALMLPPGLGGHALGIDVNAGIILVKDGREVGVYPMTSGAGKYRNDPASQKVPFAGPMRDSLPGTYVEARFVRNNYEGTGHPFWGLFLPGTDNTHLWGPKSRYDIGLHALRSDATAGCGGLPEFALVDGKKAEVVDPFMKALAQFESWPTSIFNTKTAHANAEENASMIKAEVERSLQLSTPALITVKAEGTPFDPATNQAFFTNPLILSPDVVATPPDPGNRRAGFYRQALRVPVAADSAEMQQAEPELTFAGVTAAATPKLVSTILVGEGSKAIIQPASWIPADHSPLGNSRSLRAQNALPTLEDFKGKPDYAWSIYDPNMGVTINNNENISVNAASFKKYMAADYLTFLFDQAGKSIEEWVSKGTLEQKDRRGNIYKEPIKGHWLNNLECKNDKTYPGEAELLMRAAATSLGKSYHDLCAGMYAWLDSQGIEPAILGGNKGPDGKWLGDQSLSGSGEIATATAMKIIKDAVKRHPKLFGGKAPNGEGFDNQFDQAHFGSGSLKVAKDSKYEPADDKIHGVAGVYGVLPDGRYIAIYTTNVNDGEGTLRAEKFKKVFEAALRSPMEPALTPADNPLKSTAMVSPAIHAAPGQSPPAL